MGSSLTGDIKGEIMINWNSKNVHLTKSELGLKVTLDLTPSEVVKIIYENFNNEQIVQIIGEILANYTKEVSDKVKSKLDENN